MICWTLGITEHHVGVDNVLSLINLALLCGHVGRYGSGLNPLRGQNNVQGGGDMGAIPNKLTGFQDIERDDAARAQFEAAWDCTITPRYGWHLTQMFHAMERGELRTLYVIGENPAQSEADVQRTRQLLRELDFMVVQDIFLTKTAELADVVLPAAASWCESEGTVTNSERRVQRMPQGARAAGRRPRRHLDPERDRQAARPRLGRPDGRAGVGRGALALAHARAACGTTGSRRSAASSGRARTRTIPARRSCTSGSGRRPGRAARRRRSRSSSTSRRTSRSTPSTRCG